jgi:hypothetical protein
MLINDLITELRPYYDENLSHYNKFSYLLTFVDKVPIEKYINCSPFNSEPIQEEVPVLIQETRQEVRQEEVPVPIQEVRQEVPVPIQRREVQGGPIVFVDSFLSCLFNRFNKDFTEMNMFLKFNEFKRAFFNDLKYNLKHKDKKLLPFCEKFNINDSMLHFIAKRYFICIKIKFNDTISIYGNESMQVLLLNKINNKVNIIK